MDGSGAAAIARYAAEMTPAEPPRRTDPPAHVSARHSPPTVLTLWLGGAALLWVLYAFVFVGTQQERLGQALADALANVLPLALLAAAVRAILRAEVMRRSPTVQALSHAVLALAFTFLWYAGLIVSLALLSGVEGRGVAVSGFSGPALTWQVFQGLILYGAVAAVCYAVRGGREAATVEMFGPPSAPAPLVRYLIRSSDDEITPVEVDDIVSITGAQDYAEVATLRGRHLVSLTLTEFEARLDPTSFVRVHRSAIINLRRLAKAEPAGSGRWLAHMTTGETVQVSRSGAQALRRLIV